MSDSDSTVNILSGNTFVVSDKRGDIEASPASPSGMFSFDTRYLSTWVLTVNGQRLQPLSIDDLQYFEARFFLVPGGATQYVDSKLSVIRHRSICGSFDEQVTILNHGEEPLDLKIRVEASSDFADLFEIKDVLQKKGSYYANVEDGQLRLGYERGTFRRETVISANEPHEVDEHGLGFTVRIEPGAEWTANLRVETLALSPVGEGMRPTLQHPVRTKRQMYEDLDDWLRRMPRLYTDHEVLIGTYRRSLVDLASLRYTPLTAEGTTMPTAGLPWFMTLFGRDSILTSLQVLPFEPRLAATTLRVLGLLQGTRLDDFRDEDPGRILHELRYGETSAFEEQPHSPYYGTADATQLWLILLDEYERWTGDAELVRELEPQARAALNWIDEYADLVGNGYVWYQPRRETGLENQCWKDSWDSISYHDGRLAPFPRATCELQGYAYDAKIRAARLARWFWQDPALADKLERDAAALKERFNRDFWVEDREFYALGIDPDGNQVDALSSNMGHLLWSGIVDESRAGKVVEHLLGPRLFTGWGIRTLADGEGRYNPIGYHVGTVWPFDNSFIAWGLRRYGYVEEAAILAEGMLDAAEYFGGRLPEAFAGYPRALTKYPVQYPTACSPQAWSTGTPMLLLRTMLGLEPHEDHLAVQPALPVVIQRIELLDIPGRWGKTDAFGRSRGEGAARRPALRVQYGAETFVSRRQRFIR